MKARCVDVNYLRLRRLYVEKAFDPKKKNNSNNKIVEL